jgi:hypothetical protein
MPVHRRLPRRVEQAPGDVARHPRQPPLRFPTPFEEHPMKKLITVAALLLSSLALSAYAADAAKPAAPKASPAAAKVAAGNKLGACSTEAKEKGLKGEERNKYLSACAKGGAAASAPAVAASADAKKAQGSKLGACSKQAKEKGLKGEERNKFLSECSKAA